MNLLENYVNEIILAPRCSLFVECKCSKFWEKQRHVGAKPFSKALHRMMISVTSHAQQPKLWKKLMKNTWELALHYGAFTTLSYWIQHVNEDVLYERERVAYLYTTALMDTRTIAGTYVVWSPRKKTLRTPSILNIETDLFYKILIM